MLGLVLFACLVLATAPLLSRGWWSYSVLTAIPALVLGGLWIFDLSKSIDHPDSGAGTAIAAAIYFLVCLMLVCSAVGRFATLGLKQWLGWRRSRTFAFELLPLIVPVALYAFSAAQMKIAKRPPPAQSSVDMPLSVSLGGHETRLPVMDQLRLNLEDGYDVPRHQERLNLTDPIDQRLACELSGNGTIPLRLSSFEISSTTELGHDCPDELARWDSEYCRTGNLDRTKFVPRTLSFETEYEDINDWFSGNVTSFGLYTEAKENNGINALQARLAARKGYEPRQSEFFFAEKATTPTRDPITVACTPFADEAHLMHCEVRYEIRDGLYVNYDFGVLPDQIPAVLPNYEQTARLVFDQIWRSD